MVPSGAGVAVPLVAGVVMVTAGRVEVGVGVVGEHVDVGGAGVFEDGGGGVVGGDWCGVGERVGESAGPGAAGGDPQVVVALLHLESELSSDGEGVGDVAEGDVDFDPVGDSAVVIVHVDVGVAECDASEAEVVAVVEGDVGVSVLVGLEVFDGAPQLEGDRAVEGERVAGDVSDPGFGAEGAVFGDGDAGVTVEVVVGFWCGVGWWGDGHVPGAECRGVAEVEPAGGEPGVDGDGDGSCGGQSGGVVELVGERVRADEPGRGGVGERSVGAECEGAVGWAGDRCRGDRDAVAVFVVVVGDQAGCGDDAGGVFGGGEGVGGGDGCVGSRGDGDVTVAVSVLPLPSVTV